MQQLGAFYVLEPPESTHHLIDVVTVDRTEIPESESLEKVSKLPARLDQDQVAAGVIVGHAQKMQFDVRGGPYALNILIRLPEILSFHNVRICHTRFHRFRFRYIRNDGCILRCRSCAADEKDCTECHANPYRNLFLYIHRVSCKFDASHSILKHSRILKYDCFDVRTSYLKYRFIHLYFDIHSYNTTHQKKTPENLANPSKNLPH